MQAKLFVGTIFVTSMLVSGVTPQQPLNKVLVIGGDSDGEYIASVEVVDLYNSSCSRTLSDFPIVSNGVTAGLFTREDGSMFVKACGGMDQRECFDYDGLTNQWTDGGLMHFVKYYPQSSFVGSEWVVVGSTESTSVLLESWDQGAFYLSGITMPEQMYHHCQVTLSNTHVFFANGETGNAFILDYPKHEWTQLESMNQHLGDEYDAYLSCGKVISNSRGTDIVLVGYGKSEIFNLDSMTWRPGKFVLPAMERYGSAQISSTSFVLVGGYDEETSVYSDSILQFDPAAYDMVELGQKLIISRRAAGAVAVPNDFLAC